MAEAKMQERKDALLVRFEKPGDKIEGHLAGIVKTTIEGKPGVDLYFAQNERVDQFAKIHATRKILEKIRSGDVGRRVLIRYRGENQEVKTAGNKMREFDVLVDTAGEPRTDLLMETSLLEEMD